MPAPIRTPQNRDNAQRLHRPDTDLRFTLLRRLGEGATGAVFLATDRETGEQVALKKLFKLDQKSVLRFKREFRSLADIVHPNLVKLYEASRFVTGCSQRGVLPTV